MKRTKKFLLAILATLTAGFCALGVACGKDESSSRQSTGNEPTSSESTGSESTGSESTGGESTGSESGKDTTDESVYLQGLEFLLQEDGTYGVKAGAASALSEITIPATYQGKKVSVVLDNFFGEANARTQKVVISDGIEKIEDEAFYDCDSLTSVVIPDSVTSIGEYAFKACSSLTSVVIGNGITDIGSNAFQWCDSLTSVYITDLEAWCNIWFNNASANPLSGAKLYLNNELVTELVIPNKVTEIAGYTFYDCDSLTSVVIPDSVTSIGEYTFYDCDSLTSVEIPDSVTSIGEYTFYDCDSLTSVVIPDFVTSIDEYTFYDCDSLTSVVIPDSVTSIGYYAFRDCDSLTIYSEAASMPSGWSSYWKNANCPVVWDCDNNDVASDGYIYVMVDNIRYSIKDVEINEISFYGIKDSIATVVRQASNIQTATIPASISYKGTVYRVTSISYCAFFNCDSLTSVEIGDGVTSIDYGAFANCDSLTSVVIGDGVTSIGEKAFAYCDSLTSVVIPDSVTSIGNWAFDDCSSLTSITFAGTKAQWNEIEKDRWSSGSEITKVVCKDGAIRP